MHKQDKHSAPITLASPASSPASASSSLASEVTVCTWGGTSGEVGWDEGGGGSAARMAGWVMVPDTGLLKCEYDIVICCVTPPPTPSQPGNEHAAWSMAHAAVRHRPRVVCTGVQRSLEFLWDRMWTCACGRVWGRQCWDCCFVLALMSCFDPGQLTRSRRHVVLFGDERHLSAQLPWAGLCAAARVCAGAGNKGDDGSERSGCASGGVGRQAVHTAWELLP